jgi:hypothetical protein
MSYESTSTKVLGAEHLVAICLQTGRTKDRERVRILQEEADLDSVYLSGAPQLYSRGPVDFFGGIRRSMSSFAKASEDTRQHSSTA